MEIIKNFIVIEGIDGSGTTTLLKNLGNKFKEEGIILSEECEPTDGPVGLLIRKILCGSIKVEPETLATLFSADRREHLFHPQKGVLESCKKGYVISDRYLFSSLAYQSMDCSFDYVKQLNDDFPLPEHLIFLDLPTDIAQERMNKRDSVREIFDEEYTQNKVRDKYHQVLEYYSKSNMKIHTMDGREKPVEILNKCWTSIFS